MRSRQLLLAGVALLLPLAATAYDGQTHQRLTFLAAKQFNRCVAGTNVAPLTPLQVRYMARSNASLADGNLFSRMFRWHYYDRAGEDEQSALWVIDTRFHAHFNELERRIEDASNEVDVYRQLGRILSYLQLVTSPPHVVPVYTARFWRFSFTDRFDSYRVEDADIEAALGDDCSFLEAPPLDYGYILSKAARSTLAAVEQTITGMPTSWQAFWRLAEKDGAFGDYGPAGNNFGRKTEFRCGNGERCLLLKDDPLYQEFALARYVDAVRASVAAIYMVQMRNAYAGLSFR